MAAGGASAAWVAVASDVSVGVGAKVAGAWVAGSGCTTVAVGASGAVVIGCVKVIGVVMADLATSLSTTVAGTTSVVGVATSRSIAPATSIGAVGVGNPSKSRSDSGVAVTAKRGSSCVAS